MTATHGVISERAKARKARARAKLRFRLSPAQLRGVPPIEEPETMADAGLSMRSRGRRGGRKARGTGSSSDGFAKAMAAVWGLAIEAVAKQIGLKPEALRVTQG